MRPRHGATTATSHHGAGATCRASSVGATPGGGDAAAPGRHATKGRPATKGRAARMLGCNETGPPRPDGATPQLPGRPAAKGRAAAKARAAGTLSRSESGTSRPDREMPQLPGRPAAKGRAAVKGRAAGMLSRSETGTSRPDRATPQQRTGLQPRIAPQHSCGPRGRRNAPRLLCGDGTGRRRRRGDGPASGQRSGCNHGRQQPPEGALRPLRRPSR